MEDKRKKIEIALKKARTSIDQILSAIESPDEKKCFKIIQQTLAVIGLLKSVNVMMLEIHIDNSFDGVKKFTHAEKRKIKTIRDDILRIVQIAQNK